MERKTRKEFTLEERQHLHTMVRDGKGFEYIGRILNRDPKVVSRAAKRYEPKSPFTRREQTALERAKWDDERHRERLKKPKERLRLKTKERQEYVKSRLHKASPEKIAGRYKLDHPDQNMSTNSIYEWIYLEEPDLVSNLKIVSKRGNRKRTGKNQYRYKKPAAEKRLITERFPEANDRSQFGHLERDSVMGKKGTSACVQNIADRKIRLVLLSKLHNCDSDAASAATRERLKKFPVELRRSMTQDNGPENSNHAEEEQELELPQFFCHPYSAYERGTVEQLNGSVIRSAFPKGTDFSFVNHDQIKAIETLHNNNPMKVLGFRTPIELLTEELAPFGLVPQDVGLNVVPW